MTESAPDMAFSASESGPDSRFRKGQRFRLALQRNRLLTYTLATAIAVLFQWLGVLKVPLADILWIWIFAHLAGIVPVYAAYRGTRGRRTVNFDLAWMLCDVLIISWGTFVSGGINSTWFIWYVAPVGAAAFLGGVRWVTYIGVSTILAYITVLVLHGDIRGLDINLWTALGRMAFLHGASSFTLWGVTGLQKKRQVIAALRDADARKMEELTRLTGALDETTRELQDANHRILEADRLKSQFLANMSHELRTPLNSIIGFSDVLITRLGNQIPPKHLKFLQNINTSGQHLLRIINDILDLSKIEAGKMELHPEPVSVASTIEGVCHVMKGMAAKHEVEISQDVPSNLPVLETDAVKFKQVLYNLLSNAVKFSPARSSVLVRAQTVPAANSPLGKDAIMVRVTDHGPGIDPRDHDLIFQEFRQVDGGMTRRHQGTGLGLALVKKIVEMQGGAVTVDSTPGHGATFTVIIPRRFEGIRDVSAGAHPQSLSKLETPARRPRVLVIEDDPIAYERIGQALLSSSYIPFRARNAGEAITLAHTLSPAAITLDLVLPGLDGWEILKALKADPVTRDVPVIIISVVDNRDLGLALGAEDYLLKPIDPERLTHRLAEILDRSSRKEGPVLLVDDDPQVHALLESVLPSNKYTVLHAMSGEEALAMASQNAPSLLILDLMMRGMDGFEVARRMKEDPALSEIPILVLTARDLSRSDREKLAGRITALVQKGTTTPSQLVRIIDGLVGKPAAEASNA